MDTTLSAIGRVAAQVYLWLVVLFLFFPALVLVAFSFNKSPFFTDWLSTMFTPTMRPLT